MVGHYNKMVMRDGEEAMRAGKNKTTEVKTDF